MILIDKGYYDYDFEAQEKPIVWEDTVKSDEEAANIAAMFGIGRKTSPKTEEEYQEFILKEENKKWQ